MKITPRYYQEDAVNAVTEYFQQNPTGNPVIEIPTGGGKSIVLADMIQRYVKGFDARILVVTHTKELVWQDWDKTMMLWPEGKHLFGINSAGLKKRNYKKQVIFGGIQSCYRNAAKFGKVNLLIVDESHRIPVSGTGMYRTFINELLEINPNMRVCGLTATPYRMESGLIYGCSSSLIFDDLVYKSNLKELIAQGYLTKLVHKGTIENRVDNSKARLRGGEFLDEDLDRLYNDSDLIKAQAKEIVQHCADRKSWIIFTINIDHAQKVTAALRNHGISVALVHSKIDGKERDRLVEEFNGGRYQCLVNVSVFVEGFDSPKVDALIMIKPTMSPGRYYQMVGRGLRISPGKENVLILDFSGNIGTHGPIDQIDPAPRDKMHRSGKVPMKQCERCHEFCHARMNLCPFCGNPFDTMPLEDMTDANAAAISAISEPQWFDVKDVHCSKSKAGDAILAHYYCLGKKKFIQKIEMDDSGHKWLTDHLGNAIPFDIPNFFNGGFRTKMKQPKKIFVDEAGTFSKILEYQF
jgi:DNA repair protein RadD